MSDRPRNHRSDDPENVPASLIFMEMMRRAAADSQPERPPDSAVETTSQPPVFVDETDGIPDDAPPVEATPPHQDPSPEPVVHVAPVPERQQERPPQQPRPNRPMTDEERHQAAALEAQRIRRVKRRQQKRRARRVSALGGVIRAFLVVIPAAVLMATILSWWTDPAFLNPDVRRDIQAAIDQKSVPSPQLQPTAIPNYMRTIGVIAGHHGPGRLGDIEYDYDPGAVCPDGLQEIDINYAVATSVVQQLQQRGYRAQIMDEFDPRLNDYEADTLVSIHANDCSDYGERVSGFLVAKADAKPEGGEDTKLAECIASHYGRVTNLERRYGVTIDMTDYHNFREIHPATPAAIIELGFMLADRQILTEEPDLLATGIVNGIECYLRRDFEQPGFIPNPAQPDDAIPGVGA